MKNHNSWIFRGKESLNGWRSVFGGQLDSLYPSSLLDAKQVQKNKSKIQNLVGQNPN